MPGKPTVKRAKRGLSRTQEKPLASKLAVSLYPPDIDQLDKIKRYMLGRGIRNITDSSAIRLACRAVKLSPMLVKIFETMKAEDGRRQVSR